MKPLLQIKNLSVDFITEQGTVHAIQDIGFTVNHGETVALVGESGSGKSVTSLSVLQLLASPPAQYTSGEIFFLSEENLPVNLLNIGPVALQKIRGHKIAMVFQEPMTSLNPVLTCGEQITEVLLTHQKISKKEARLQALEWFKKVKLPDPGSVFKRYPHQLSGGQKQRVMIAMAMCCNPSLLICDEPTTALDVTIQKTILGLIKELQQQTNMGVIFITHDLGVVAEIADRAVVLYKGKVAEEGTVKEIFTKPQHPYTKALLACRPAHQPKGKRLPVVTDFLDPEKGLSNQPQQTQNTEVAISDKTDHILIDVKNLSVHFPVKNNFFGKTLTYTRAVDDISFQVFSGETLGLVGESGCGKTTLGRTLLQLIKPTGGQIIYRGNDLSQKTKSQLNQLRKDIQIIFQDPYSSLNPRITIGAAIAEPMKVHHILSSKQQRKDKVAELLEKVNLKPEHISRYPHEFSGGQRQRIVIARALALNPSFIVCDESVSALDVSVQAQVLNLLNDLKKEFRFTSIFISHDLSVVRYISDRIMVMNKGKIEETGDAEMVYTSPRSPYTRQLIESIPRGIVH